MSVVARIPAGLALVIVASLSTAAPARPAATGRQPLAPPALPTATLDDRLDVTGDAIDAQQIQTRMAVPVTVNGQGPYRFIVDSGADRTVIGEALARRLALPADDMVNLRGMAGAARVATVRIDRLGVGGGDVRDVIAPALPERFLGAQGLLGIDALAEQRLMLDFEKREITVQDSRRPVQASADEIVVTARRRHGQLILTQVNVLARPIYAVIDTGAQVTIGNSALLAAVSRRHTLTGTPISLVSVTGQSVTASLIVLPAIGIGKVVLRDVPVAFADVPPFELFGLGRQPAMLLGTDTLEAFRRVSLDFGRRRVRFALRR